jgi:hypothetical protein
MSRRLSGWSRLQRASRLASLLALLSAGACASVLGIEDIHEGPPPDAIGGDDGTGATDATGGTKPNTGGSKNGGSSGNDNLGGDALGGAPTEGGSSAIEGGAGGAPPSTDPTVRGRVIDFWGQAVPNIPIQIGDELKQTDAQGKFEFADVPGEYDVSLAVELDPITSHGYAFMGLTLREPTLQIYSGLTDRSGNIKVAAVDVTVGASQEVAFSIGAPGGAEQYTGYDGGVETSFYWRGGMTNQGTAHALYWQYNANELPTAYLGFDSTLVALSSAGTTNISFTLQGDPLESGQLQGMVTERTGTDRENDVFLRFASGDRIQLVEDYPNAPASFSYLVPNSSEGDITVSASEGYAEYGAYAVVHNDGLGVGSTANLAIPAPGSLVAPVDNKTGVDLTTQFSYLAGEGSAGTHLVAIHNIYESCCYDAIYIATTKTQLTIPPIVGNNFLKGGEGYYWRIETHGKYKTVDDMAGPTGYLDSFSADEATPQGPRNSDGQYSITSSRVFTAAP